jgi:hypothetical protein
MVEIWGQKDPYVGHIGLTKAYISFLLTNPFPNRGPFPKVLFAQWCINE